MAAVKMGAAKKRIARKDIVKHLSDSVGRVQLLAGPKKGIMKGQNKGKRMLAMSFNDAFLKAFLKESAETVPVWYMRQAGRYDPEYRKIKKKYTLLEICAIPELAAEVTLMPVRKLGVGAATL